MNQGAFKHALQASCAICGVWLFAAPAPHASAEPSADCRGSKTEIEGTVAQVEGTCPKLRFKIGDTKVVTREKTAYDDGPCGDVANARQVEARGTLSADGTLTACKIEFDDDDGDDDEGNDED